jgi:hypothetical protein
MSVDDLSQLMPLLGGDADSGRPPFLRRADGKEETANKP